MLEEFLGPTVEQLKLVKEQGRLIDMYVRSEQMIGLYQVRNRWIEVVVDQQSNHITRLKEIDTDTLAGYLPAEIIRMMMRN